MPSGPVPTVAEDSDLGMNNSEALECEVSPAQESAVGGYFETSQATQTRRSVSELLKSLISFKNSEIS